MSVRRRPSGYVSRTVVPHDLRPAIGRREIVRLPKTGSSREAKRPGRRIRGPHCCAVQAAALCSELKALLVEERMTVSAYAGRRYVLRRPPPMSRRQLDRHTRQIRPHALRAPVAIQLARAANRHCGGNLEVPRKDWRGFSRTLALADLRRRRVARRYSPRRPRPRPDRRSFGAPRYSPPGSQRCGRF